MTTPGLAVAVALAWEHHVDADLWWHLAAGRETMARGWPPAVDGLTHVAVQHEWPSGTPC